MFLSSTAPGVLQWANKRKIRKMEGKETRNSNKSQVEQNRNERKENTNTSKGQGRKKRRRKTETKRLIVSTNYINLHASDRE